MSPAPQLPMYDDEKSSLEKDQDQDQLDVIDVQKLKEADELEDRIKNDTAEEGEYRVEAAYEVATKVLSARDDPELPAVTFRTVFLGLGFSAFGAVLAQIYYFKPQTLLVSILLLLVLSYWFGNAMHMLLPSRGLFRWLNPGPFNSE
ncbi:uncharacterized protein FIBRA_01615 [Fibroporia radiculosa]|uniref:Uncharacterized protein n=1 Tax=Fibroporia radiculosa TaxID=599839 RepID=J4HTM0_9APHY|nr:uncharacterized protein FIBRA_01615 [Fibroporia radiculosa]CCL99597.1 predicted protein [Fibroporia radiculosa]